MKEEIKTYIQQLLSSINEQEIEITDDLDLNSVGFTSFYMISVIEYLERLYSFTFDDDLLFSIHLNTINRIEECARLSMKNPEKR